MSEANIRKIKTMAAKKQHLQYFEQFTAPQFTTARKSEPNFSTISSIGKAEKAVFFSHR